MPVSGAGWERSVEMARTGIMRKITIIAAVALATLVCVLLSPASAEDPPLENSSVHPAAPEFSSMACTSANPELLGVSRVVEIDTTNAPLLGRMQYNEFDFLEEGEVVLTFDDGPLRRYTLPILDALDGACTKATFFVVGRMALVDPETLKEIDARGHTIGTHTWSHKNLRGASEKVAIQEFELGVSTISKALGKPIAPFFRFPYLNDSKTMIKHLRERHTAVFSIDIDTYDYRARNPAQVRQRVMAGLKAKGKGIILFHDIQRSTAGAIKDLLVELKAGGYKIVHLVSKAPATTVADYDVLAEKELARRKTMAALPLSTRTMVWPMLPGGVPKSELKKDQQEPSPETAENPEKPTNSESKVFTVKDTPPPRKKRATTARTVPRNTSASEGTPKAKEIEPSTDWFWNSLGQ